jgi:hypothetical protein
MKKLAKNVGKKDIKKGDAVIAVTTSSEALITQRNRASLEHQAETFKSMVRAIRVTNEQECQTARTILTRIITAKQKAQSFINPVLQNAKEGLRLAKEQEAALVGPFETLRVELKETINGYLTQVMLQERKQREEQERLKREYEEKVAKSKRPERIKEPEPLPEDEVVNVPMMENTSIPMVPKYRIEDESKVPEKYWARVINQGKMWEEIRTAHKNGEMIEIPGVRIWEEASLTIRGGR